MSQYESPLRISGGNEPEKIAAEGKIRENRQQQERRLKGFEIPITEKESRIIGQVEDLVDAEIRRYGCSPGRISVDQIHLVRPGSLPSLQGGSFKHGFAVLLERYVVLERGPSDTAFALHLAHELFHLKSPKTVRLPDSKPQLYRSGMIMVDPQYPEPASGHRKWYLAKLEEALVADATDRVFQELTRSNEFVSAEVTLFAAIKPWLRKMWAATSRTAEEGHEMIDAFRAIPIINAKEILETLEDGNLTEDRKLTFLYDYLRNLHKTGAICEAERFAERRKLDTLVDDLVSRYNGKMTREQVMAKLSEANFTGHYLGISRMIEGAMGKGAFRQVAEEFSETRETAP